MLNVTGTCLLLEV